MPSLPRPVILAFLAFATVLPISAQNKTKASLGVRTLALDKSDIPDVFIKTPDGKFTLLEFSTIQPTASQRVVATPLLYLYEKKKEPKNGEEPYGLLQTVKLPANTKNIILLTWGGSDKKPRFRAIKDNIMAAKFNDWLLINTTTYPIYLQVESKTKPTYLSPASSKLFRVKASKGTGTSVVAQAKLKDGKGKDYLKPIYSTYLPAYPNKRFILLFVNDGKRIRVRDISDKLPPRKQG